MLSQNISLCWDYIEGTKDKSIYVEKQLFNHIIYILYNYDSDKRLEFKNR